MRFSLGMYNTEEEVDYVLDILPDIIAKLRAASPATTTKKTANALAA